MAETPPQPTRSITDPGVLKALAHPLRLRLYELLHAEGPATASALAEHVDEAVGLLSYHLHQLARHGYVEEAPELARDGRERWWRAVEGGIRWSTTDFQDDPASRRIVSAAQRHMDARRFDRLREWQTTSDAWGREWVDAADSSDSLLRLTPAELQEFTAELHEVLRRWTRKPASTESGERREHVFHFSYTFPFVP